MKKSVVILIALIYVVSIALVSFFGLQFKVFNEIIPVESIELLNKPTDYQEKTNSETGELEIIPYFVISPNANGERVFQIEVRVHPDDATDKKVEYSYDTSKTFVTVSEDGLVRFERAGAVTVYITPADNSDVKIKLIIIAE